MNAAFPSDGRLAGIDYGTVRIGIAVTDPERRLASPWDNYDRQSPAADADYFRRLVEAEGIVGFVVGLPVHASGEEGEKCREARRFGQWLAELTGRPVRFFDERYSSVQAEQWLAGADLSRKQRKQRRDMLAAQIMLAAYLESPAAEPPGALDD